MKKQVSLIGLGPGNPALLTQQAQQALRDCTHIIGARRALDALCDQPARKSEAIAAGEIGNIVRQSADDRLCVVFTGDIGLYSGARKLYAELRDFEIISIPGVSSLQYFAAKLCRPWQSTQVISGHGIACDVLSAVMNHSETFFLTDSTTTPQRICAELTDHGLGGLTVHIGEQLSYEDERIVCGNAEELSHRQYDSLSVVWVDNPAPFDPRPATYGLADDVFIRAKVPMTKRYVRAAILARMAISPDEILYDVGAGTGSVSIEMAQAARNGRVYAIERAADALALIEQNKGRFAAHNLIVCPGEAPNALRGLPAPDAAFIGGSGGQLHDIVSALAEKNPRVRLVIGAVTLETLCEAQDVLRNHGFEAIDVVQLSVTESKPVGSYHMMLAQNPIFLISGVGKAVNPQS